MKCDKPEDFWAWLLVLAIDVAIVGFVMFLGAMVWRALGLK